MLTRSLLVAAATVAATAGVLAAPTSASAASSAPSSSAATAGTSTARAAAATTYATSARRATNRNRVSHSRAKVKKNACLTRYALAQATAMARSNSMFHQSLAPVQAGCKVGWVGENVAYGFASGGTVVNDGWMKSAGHRANILNAHYRKVGIAAVQSSNGTWYVSQVLGKKV